MYLFLFCLFIYLHSLSLFISIVDIEDQGLLKYLINRMDITILVVSINNIYRVSRMNSPANLTVTSSRSVCFMIYICNYFPIINPIWRAPNKLGIQNYHYGDVCLPYLFLKCKRFWVIFDLLKKITLLILLRVYH